MSRQKQFLSVGEKETKNDKKLLRFNVQESLKYEGLIEEVDLNDDSIEIIETRGSATLKKVSIRELDFKDKKSRIETIWKINLEKNIPGISTQGKTAEVALIILQKYETGDYKLNVCLIEMKSSLQPRTVKKGESKPKPSSLTDIKEKIQCNMNQMYMLMSLNNHQNPRKGYSGVSIHIDFKGIIIFNKNEISSDDDSNDSDLYKILTSDNRAELFTVRTILNDKDKITMKFFPPENNQPQEHRTLQLGDLL
ncbi:conserved hypothetical protein [Planktothrix sp. PCC 11201]|uniref:hypothetical protein n=1 Tax=Planktothrix sp. PCC 11201 TaxID=1729650 RepID=UPI0009133B85|nr:hypothetical protein [Planktothrix sp. PCC 11201]SKB14477.1 conserved hypothetical protein [Planktothrix sp. PCC 11201]